MLMALLTSLILLALLIEYTFLPLRLQRAWTSPPRHRQELNEVKVLPHSGFIENTESRRSQWSVAISGGGSRSFVASVGYFRALQKSGLSPAYISSVSGGSWFSAMYLHSGKTLGRSCGVGAQGHVVPSAITSQELATANNSAFFIASNLYKEDLLRWDDMNRDDTWTLGIGRVFGSGDFAWDAGAEDAPFWICNATANFADGRVRTFEFTPLYAGITNVAHFALTDRAVLGTKICIQDKDRLLTTGAVATITDALGMSSALHSFVIANKQHLSSLLRMCLPHSTQKYVQKCVVLEKDGDRLLHNSVKVCDGGQLDNSGVLSLLKRGARRVLFLNNTNIPFKKWFREGENNLPSLFGATNPRTKYCSAPNDIQVFSTSDYFNRIVPQLEDCENRGDFLFARATLRVMPNHKHGVEGDYDVDFAVLTLCRAPNFVNRLPREVRAQIENEDFRLFDRHERALGKFPLYDTALETPLGVSTLFLNQINLLSTYCEWAMDQHIAELINDDDR